MIIQDANIWCDSLNGTLSRIGRNNLEVVESQAPGGCHGGAGLTLNSSIVTNAYSLIKDSL